MSLNQRPFRSFILILLWASISVRAEKPNIHVIRGDDVGMWNIIAYHSGKMEGSTPNIDRIARGCMLLMDHYAQSSCTAGGAAFITGQYPVRMGLTTVGLPGAKEGTQDSDPTFAQMLKDRSYATGQSGKNHLRDRDEHLPAHHESDAFFGILYHFNAGEHPEQHDFPKDEEVMKRFKLNQRDLIHSKALADGDQEIKDLGPWSREKQRTLDQDVLVESKRFIKDAVEAEQPFFDWHNTTRMNYRTNLCKEYDNKSGYGLYPDCMMEMNDNVVELLDHLDEVGITDNTIIMFSRVNGAPCNSWPDGGNHPFNGEKGVGGWEGGFRVPVMVQWQDKIPADTTTGEFMTMVDWVPKQMAWVGDDDIKEDLLNGMEIGDKIIRVHLAGYVQSDLLLNHGKSKRKEFFYITETVFHGMTYGDWKLLFIDHEKWFRVAQAPLTTPILINLKLAPFDRFIEARGYGEWAENRSWIFGQAGMGSAKFVETFIDDPPSQKGM